MIGLLSPYTDEKKVPIKLGDIVSNGQTIFRMGIEDNAWVMVAAVPNRSIPIPQMAGTLTVIIVNHVECLVSDRACTKISKSPNL